MLGREGGTFARVSAGAALARDLHCRCTPNRVLVSCSKRARHLHVEHGLCAVPQCCKTPAIGPIAHEMSSKLTCTTHGSQWPNAFFLLYLLIRRRDPPPRFETFSKLLKVLASQKITMPKGDGFKSFQRRGDDYGGEPCVRCVDRASLGSANCTRGGPGRGRGQGGSARTMNTF